MSKFRRKVLIVSYLFPPAGGVPVQRALSLARYLPACGFEVHVLSAGNPTAPTIDAGLVRLIPEEVRVHRTFTPELPFNVKEKLWRWFSGGRATKPRAAAASAPPTRTWKSAAAEAVRKIFCPDPEVVWVPFALRRARRIVARHGIDAVLVTAPPFSSFLIGNSLKRRFPHLTLVSDFRDEWLRFYLSTFDFHRRSYVERKAAAIERATVELSDAVVTVTDSIVGQLRDRYTDQPPGKFTCIPNGYDPESFRGFKARPHGGSGIVVTHVGTVYKASSTRYYLDALDRMPDSIRSRFEARLIGRITEEEKSVLEGRKSAVKTLGFLPQAEAFRLMEETDFLLVTMTDPSALTGKLFEYLATGKPILAFAPEDGEIARILRETGAGWCAEPGDLEAGERLLIRAYEMICSRTAPPINREAVRRFERPKLAAEFGGLIRDCLASIRT